MFARFQLEQQQKIEMLYNKDFLKINGKQAIKIPRNS